MKRSIYLELVLAFTIIVFFSISIPFIIFQNSIDTIVKNYLQDQIVTNVKNTINTLEKYNLPPETLAELVDFDHISTDIRKDLSSLSLSAKNIKQLDTDHVTLLYNSKQNLVTAVADYENHYILIQWNTSSLARSLKQLGKISTGCSMLLGILIILIFGRIYTKVIRDLRTATQKVTAGDFTQQLPIHNYSDELVSLINSFNKMTKQLQSVEMLRSGFISDVSHQFKTPLTAIEGFARLLEHTKDDNVRKECADVISCETNRLSQLTDNILMLNRLNKDTDVLNMQPIRIDEQIRHALALNETNWTDKNLTMNVQLNEVILNGNASLLSQVWMNLIDNAIKFTPQNGCVTVILQADEPNHCTVSVQNDGEPIPNENLAHIFEKFYRADSTGTTQGNGLGLSIVQKVVQLHSGKIQVESNEECGTTFTVFL